MITNPVRYHLRCVMVAISLEIGLLCDQQRAHNNHYTVCNVCVSQSFRCMIDDYVLSMKCNQKHKLPPLPLCSTDSHWQWIQEHPFGENIRWQSFP